MADSRRPDGLTLFLGKPQTCDVTLVSTLA